MPSPSIQARACDFIEMAFFIKEELNSQMSNLFYVAVSDGGDKAASDAAVAERSAFSPGRRVVNLCSCSFRVTADSLLTKESQF